MINKNNTRGSVFVDVIAAMFIMTMTSILVFNTIFFNMKVLNNIKNTDEMVSQINDDITIMFAKKEYINKETKECKTVYSKRYVGSINGTDFYKLNIDISQERSGIKRSYETLISE